MKALVTEPGGSFRSADSDAAGGMTRPTGLINGVARRQIRNSMIAPSGAPPTVSIKPSISASTTHSVNAKGLY
ncbi:hypothetical protein ACIOKD_24230 [Streptomyces sp. NPDC087844]|uniref:hypothetical protein n=1 Tax=Streptomyces sp. NPDC087844 TaxID=3365805 RepID=UPI0038183B00